MDTFDWQTLAVWLIVGAAFIAIAGRFVLRHLGGSRRAGHSRRAERAKKNGDPGGCGCG